MDFKLLLVYIVFTLSIIVKCHLPGATLVSSHGRELTTLCVLFFARDGCTQQSIVLEELHHWLLFAW